MQLFAKLLYQITIQFHFTFASAVHFFLCSLTCQGLAAKQLIGVQP